MSTYRNANEVLRVLQTHPELDPNIVSHLKRHWRQVRREYSMMDRLEIRAEVKAQIDQHAEDGMLYFVLWSRDCDMFETTKVTKCLASVFAFEQLQEGLDADAEGPYTLDPITKEEARLFKGTFRDRAMEAFENGYGTAHVIH